MATLSDSTAKLAWASKNMLTLATALKSFFDSNPCEFYEESSHDKTQIDVKLRLSKPIPNEIAHIVGDIIHNLRASLDFAACDLAELNGATSLEGVYFPFGKTKESFEASSKEKMRKLSNRAKEHIRSLMPYRGGNEILWLIHYLDLGDKHRRLTPIGMVGSTGAKIDILTSGGIRLANPKWSSLMKGMRVATIQNNTQWTGQISANTTVSFGEVESISNMPVEPLVTSMVSECESALSSIRRAFFQ